MDTVRVYADPQKTDDLGRLILTCRGTQQDLQRFGLTLTDGLFLNFWRDDADEQANPDPLHFEGVVHYDHAAGRWIAEIDWSHVHNASEDNAGVQERESVLR